MDKREAKQARSIAKQVVKSIVGVPEIKWIDATGSGVVPNTGIVSSYGTAQGVNVNQRTGNQVRWLSFNFRSKWVANPNSTAGCIVRVIIGIDRENQGATPTVAQILETPGSDVLSALNISTTRGRFSILWDKEFTVGAGAVVASIPAGTMQMNQAPNGIRFVAKLQNLHRVQQEYTGTTATATSIGTPWVLMISDVAAGNAPTGSTFIRLRFQDV